MLSRQLGIRDVNTLIDRMLDDVTVRLLIACEPGDMRRILGWMAYSPAPRTAVIHYAYTREKVRNRGVATQLMRYAWPESPSKIVYTMRGPSATWLVNKHPDAVFLAVDEYLRS